MTSALGAARPYPPSGDAVAEFDALLATRSELEAVFKRVRSSFGQFVARRQRSAELVARRAEQCLENGHGASFLRLGDGEGNFLALELDGTPALTEYCARKISNRHFGVPDTLLDAAPDLLGRYRTALHNAELIGIPGPHQARGLLGQPRDSIDVRGAYGTVAVYWYLDRFADELALGQTVGTFLQFPRAMFPLFPELLRGRDVGLISCRREIVAGLREEMGARSVTFLPVPGQGRRMRPTQETGHYPHRYRELIDELRSAQPGTLYLVAAGILAEIYCDVIREAGAVAIDVGSVVDVWAGIGSRKFATDKVVRRWALVDPSTS